MGIASVVIGVLLTKGGYIPNVEQTPQALKTIEITFIWVPLILCILIIISALFYDLDTKLESMRKELNKRISKVESEV